DVNVQPGDAKIFQIPILLEDALSALDIDAELRLLLAGCRLDVRAWIDVRIDAQRANGSLADLAGDAIDVLDLGFGLEIERGDAVVQRCFDFVVSLADTGENDLRRITAGLDCAVEFA